MVQFARRIRNVTVAPSENDSSFDLGGVDCAIEREQARNERDKRGNDPVSNFGLCLGSKRQELWWVNAAAHATHSHRTPRQEQCTIAIIDSAAERAEHDRCGGNVAGS